MSLSKNTILDLRQVHVLYNLTDRLTLHFALDYTFSTVSTVCVTGRQARADSSWEQENPKPVYPGDRQGKLLENGDESHLSSATFVGRVNGPGKLPARLRMCAQRAI